MVDTFLKFVLKKPNCGLPYSNKSVGVGVNVRVDISYMLSFAIYLILGRVLVLTFEL